LSQDRAIERNTIVIDGKSYWTNGKVRLFDASQQPGKIVIGESSAADNPHASEWNIGDIRGGIGVEIMNPDQDADRIWFGDIQTRYKDRIVLPRLATATSNSPATTVQTLTEFGGNIYGTFGTAVHVYNNSTDTWGSSLNTLLNSATGAASGLVGGTETLVIATGSEVDYTTDGTTYNRNTTNIKYIVFWKDLLWGIDQSGQLYYTDDLSTDWTTDAKLQLPDNRIVKLLIARGPDREEHIYAATKVGLFVHDDINQRFLPTDLQLPFHPDAGKGATVWRGSIYFPAGNSVYRFQAGSDQTIVVPVGPDRDHGLPSDKRGIIQEVVGTHNDLMVLLDASQAAGVSTPSQPTRGVRNHHGGTTSSANLGFSEILGYDERGWEVKWLSSSSARQITTSEVASAYNDYRLWWAADQTVYWQSLPVDVVNPLQVTGATYAASGSFETPWNDFNIRNQTKVALDVIVETNNPTTSETVKVEYATDYDETYTTLDDANITDGLITTTGQTKFRIVVNGDPIGEVFRAIKFRVTFARGSTTTRTPQLIKLTLVWRSVVAVLFGISAVVKANETSPDGRSVKQQVLDLKSAHASGTLVETTYKNDTTESQNYYMDLTDLQSLEEGGGEFEGGDFQVQLIEPRQSRDR
jgi:hypothetical protein